MTNVTLITNPDHTIIPRVGDILVPLSGNQIGKHGLIERIYSESNTISVGFNVTGNKVPGEFDFLTCSGGPFDTTSVDQLQLIGTKIHKFLDSRLVTGENRYDKYEETVNVWVYWPKNESYPSLNRSYDTYQAFLDSEAEMYRLRAELQKEVDELKGNLDHASAIVRNGYEICSSRHRFFEDRSANRIFAAYASNELIIINKYRTPERFQYGCWDGFYFKDLTELNSFLEAYAFNEIEIDEEYGTYRLTPNLDVSTWLPLKQVTMNSITEA
ncbi:hypothetical protein OH460_07680 [Vibrio sp. Makdt]|uniref:hypothetical protein n=1 Tax=Vibrio sp. Makdt TaxID=2998828 RepID=UPI0022CD54D7|nr:hypothetical protein [Vibrio sp. Makdt]MDA0152176.1 hypothetical protein [Vibrio sp. Makdt]